jgi:aminoglycoside phosphotransferase (APT) family kinase protein
MKRTVAVARWLESVSYPAVRALPLNQPVEIGASAVTFWKALSDAGDEYASVTEVAKLLRWLHSLTPAPQELELPSYEPLNAIMQRLDMDCWLSDMDRAFLLRRLADASERYSQLNFVLDPGVIHGDANVGNILRDSTGMPVVIDLDSFATGPREWDLIQTAMFYQEFGWHSRDEYEEFVDEYGFDIRRWDGYTVLRDIRELHMVTWLAQSALVNDEKAREARKRLKAMGDGSSRKDWEPY